MSLCVCTLHTLLPSQITENEGFSNSNNIATQEPNDIVVIFTRLTLKSPLPCLYPSVGTGNDLCCKTAARPAHVTPRDAIQYHLFSFVVDTHF